MIEVKTFHNFNDISIYSKEWDELASISDYSTIFQTFEWLKNFTEIYKSNDKISIFIVFENSRIIGIAPLQLKELNYFGFIKITKIVFLGERFSEYCNFILKPGREIEIIDLLFKELHKYNYDWIDLFDVPHHSITIDILKNLFYKDYTKTSIYSMYLKNSNPYLVIHTNSGIENYTEKFSKKTLQTLERKKRKLSNNFRISIDFNNSSTEESIKQISEFNIERIKSMGKTSFFEIEKNREFFFKIVKEFEKKGWLLESRLFLNGAVISIYICFLFQNKLFFFLSGYKSSVEEYSAGSIHLYSLIKYAFQNKFAEFNFLRGLDKYKFRWHPEQICSKRIFIIKNNAGKKFLFFIFRGFSKLKRLF